MSYRLFFSRNSFQDSGVSPFAIALALVLFCVECSVLSADIILFDLKDAAGTAGRALETSGSFTTNGMTITVETESSEGDLTSSFSANATTAGVNTGGTSLDQASQLESYELLKFTLSGSGFYLTSIDFQGVGGTGAGDAALVTVGGVGYKLETGADDFNGSTDLWTPAGGILLASGSLIEIKSENVIGLESLSIETISAIPEPASMGMLVSIAGLAGVIVRRRKVRRLKTGFDRGV